MQSPKYIDLFAGCGGLSLGLERAGWQLEFAVEKSPMAGETFFHNIVAPHRTGITYTDVLNEKNLTSKINHGLVVGPVSEILEDNRALRTVANAGVSLVVGGPPCQGFSLAGSRNPNDKRNELPWEFVNLVKTAKPIFVVMENVLGIHSKFDKTQEKSVFENLATALEFASEKGLDGKPAYVVQKVLANAMHYGAAQTRPRLLLIACRVDFAQKLGITATEEIWKSDFVDNIDLNAVPLLAPIPTQKHSGVPVSEALSDFLNGTDSDYTRFLKDKSVWSQLQNRLDANLEKRAHGARAKLKFALYQKIKQENLPRNLLKDLGDDNIHILEAKELSNVEYPFTLGNGTIVANSNMFRDLLIQHKTRKHSQRVLTLSEPAPTVVTAADDYIHPVEPRVLSVRELARFQGFPDCFEFKSKQTTGGLKRRVEVPQYSQVGNAVSPFLSYAIGKRLLAYL